MAPNPDHEAAILAFDRQGVLRAANDHAAALLGRSGAELVGMHYSSLVADPDRADAARILVEGLDAGGARPGGGLRMLRADGQLVPLVVTGFVVDSTVVVVGQSPCHSRDALAVKTGQLEAIAVATASFLEDGSWQRASGLLLKAALEHTRSASGFVGVVVEGPVLRILAYEGVAWDATINRKLYEAAMRAYRDVGYVELNNFDNLFGRVLTTGKPVISNDPARDPRSGYALPKGHPPLESFLGVPILRRDEVVGMIGVANRPGGYSCLEQGHVELLTSTASVLYDSYRRAQRESRLQERLRHSQKMEAVGRLAGGVAHDFNNVLTAITGYSELLLARLSDRDPLRKGLEEIRRAADRAASLTRQLLVFSRKQVFKPQAVDVNAVVTEMDRMLRRLIGEDIELRDVLAPAVGHVMTDRGQLEQVVMNLVLNARDAMPQGGTLTIETAEVEMGDVLRRRQVSGESGPHVMLAVSDTGCGMDAATLSHLFEPFFTTKESGRGTGLGLATVYGIVKQGSGQIFVDSKLGCGSRFEVYLPRVDEVADVQRPSSGVDWKLPRRAATVLVVEDDDAIRSLIPAILATYGYTVLSAADGDEAVEVCRAHAGPIHAVLADVVMPGMSGPVVVERLHAMRPAAKVLYMSGYTDSDTTHRKLLGPGTAFLEKPFTPDALARKLRDVLDD